MLAWERKNAASSGGRLQGRSLVDVIFFDGAGVPAAELAGVEVKGPARARRPDCCSSSSSRSRGRWLEPSPSPVGGPQAAAAGALARLMELARLKQLHIERPFEGIL